MAETKPIIGFRIDPEIKAALEKAAQDDERSVSSLVTRILRAWVIEKGYMKPPAD